jgi:non-ribosomal peptide synthetase component F
VLSRSECVSFFVPVLAAFNVMLHRYSGQEDFVVGTHISDRSEYANESPRLFSPNPLPLRTDLSGDPTFPELLVRTQKASLEAYAHQEVPLEALFAALQPERDPSNAPLFQVLFVLKNTRKRRSEVPPSLLDHDQPQVRNGTATFFTLFLAQSRGITAVLE